MIYRHVFTPLAALCLGLLFAPTGHADELLYVYGPDCGACMKFEADIGDIYPKTDEAKHLPLRKVTLEDWRAGRHPLAECKIKPILGTPTFVQVHDCVELDRITGYSNDELFWFALSRIANRSKNMATTRNDQPSSAAP